MSEFKVRTSQIRTAAQEQNDIARQMQQLEDEIWQIQNGLSFEIAQKQRIQQRLKNTRNTVSSQSKNIYHATKTLNQIADTYETTEAELSGKIVVKSVLEPITNLSDIADIIPKDIADIFDTIENMDWTPLILPGLLKIVRNTILPDGKTNLKLWDLKLKDKDDFTYSKNKDKLEDMKMDVTKIFEKKWEDTTSLYHTEQITGEKEGSYYSEKFDILKQNMNADLYGGLYYTDPETGNKKLRLAAGVGVGYTITALSTEHEARLGDDNLGIYSKVEGKIGEVGAGANATIGLRDAEGKINPTVYANASAEAILAEVSGKAGFNVLGNKIGVKAGLNFGVGAHAEFGYKDGKFSMNAGASLGLGGSVGLEVDINGVVNAVESAAEAAWKNITGFFH